MLRPYSSRIASAGVVTLVCFLALLHCQTKPQKTVEDLEAEQKKQNLAEALNEADIGRNMAGRLLKLYGTVDNEALVRYVNEVGLYVAQYSDTPNRHYMFEVYPSETVNAFACRAMASVNATHSAQTL